jgi:hypothetical protein
MKFIILSLIIALFSILLILSYIYNWEFSKKHWQENKPYHKYDKIYGITLGIALFGVAIFIFVKSL